MLPSPKRTSSRSGTTNARDQPPAVCLDRWISSRAVEPGSSGIRTSRGILSELYRRPQKEPDRIHSTNVPVCGTFVA